MHRIYAELGVNHPVMGKFIDDLRNTQHSRDLYIERPVPGLTLRRKLLNCLETDECILKIVHRFHEMQPLEYLRGFVHIHDLHSWCV